MRNTADQASPSTVKSPDAFRTISEVSDELGLPQHVLRFWETRFTQIKPMKRGGGRRLYRPDHIALLRGIKALLYDDGMTIKGVQKVLREKGTKTVIARGHSVAELGFQTTVPEDAAERLAAIAERLSTGATPKPAKKRAKANASAHDRVLASISRLEKILERLEQD